MIIGHRVLSREASATPALTQQTPVKEKKQMILTARIGDEFEYWYEATNWNSSVDCEGLTLVYRERDDIVGIKDYERISMSREEALELAAAIQLFFGTKSA